MTGESDDLKKDSVENCLIRKAEKEEEGGYLKVDKNKDEVHHHDLPSPVILSGT